MGWLFCRLREVRYGMAAHRDYTTISVPTLSDALATIALSHAAELLWTPLRDARANLLDLERAGGRSTLTFTSPRAGVTAFVRLPQAAQVQRRLAEQGVLIVPGALFGDPDRVRIGLAGPPADFATGLAQLELVA
ncbi:MAG: hypothetical protein NVS9B6_19380 [Candidatus Limnocylindrales bacterium]